MATIHLQALSRSELRAAIGEEVTVSGVVSSDPKQLSSRVIGSRLISGQSTFTIRVEELQAKSEIHSMRIPIRVISASPIDATPGDQITLSGELRQSRELRFAGLLHATSTIEVIKSSNPVIAELDGIRSAIREQSRRINRESATLLPGMALGDTSLQSEAFTSMMRNAGLSHLTAVSGANFAIVSAFIFAIIGWIKPNRKTQVLLTSIFLVLFIFLVRPTPSVLRAAVMAGVFLIARVSGERRNSLNALAFAISILLLINPFQAFDPGFILSVSATSGLIIMAPNLQRRMSARLPKWLAEILAIAISATAFCTPYLLYLAGSINSLTIIANALVAPTVPLITVLTLLATLLVSFWPDAAYLSLRLADIGASWIYQVARIADRGPAFTPELLLITLAITILIWRRFNIRMMAITLIPLLLLSASARASFPGAAWRVGQCDVGQGDALLLNLGGGNGALFDAGPDPKLLKDCLRLFGIKYLPLVVISHRHADHYQGLSTDLSIGEIWVNQRETTFANYEKVLEKRSGDRARIGDLSVEVLWPIDDDFQGEEIDGDGSAENNRSLVILAEISGVRILITGDIEPDVQRQLERKFQLDGIEILKVPHHGSKFQDPAFLSEIGASIYLVSVGANSYGHPNPGLMAELGAGDSKVYRTDQSGAISLSWELSKELGRSIFSPRELGKGWWQIRWH